MIEITLKKERNHYAKKVICFLFQLLILLISVWMFFLPQINFSEILHDLYVNEYTFFVKYSFLVIIIMYVYSFVVSNWNKCKKLIISQRKINKYKKIRKGRV